MRLHRLNLRQFKGISELDFEPAGADAAVFGDNATGKTTLADAWSWLLFGKDSSGASQFEIKTLGPNGEPHHGLDHVVEAEIELAGRRLTLRKEYKEQWTKRRGAPKKEFTGHTTDHFVDGVPVKQAEYQQTIAGIGSEGSFRLLTDPVHFSERLHWQERRQLLLEVCGDVSDQEVIASDSKLEDLPEILGDRSIDDHRKVLRARRADINRELERIPVRIDEVVRGLPEEGDDAAVRGRLAAARDARESAEAEVRRIREGGEMAEVRKALAEAEAAEAAAVAQARRDILPAIEEHQDAIAAAKESAAEAGGQVLEADRRIQLWETRIADLEEKLEERRSEWHRVNETAFELDESDTCPTCGQALPEDELEASRERALEEFNRRKAEQLESIDAGGKKIAAATADLKSELAYMSEKRASAAEGSAAAESQLAILKGRPAPEPAPVPQAILEEIERLEARLRSLTEEREEALAASEALLAELHRPVEVEEKALARVVQRQQGLARIEALESEERELAAEYERLERELFLTEEFVRVKVDLLEERINSRFELARIKLFTVLVNGALEECCDVTYEGVPYASMNHGARIQVGLDIIRTLQSHFGLEPPVVVDQCESVTRLPHLNSQVIRLMVSADDAELRIESEQAATAAA